ncbi:MAG: hypothetical protein ACREV7_14265 [Steroidobacteraceae bacterium]
MIGPADLARYRAIAEVEPDPARRSPVLFGCAAAAVTYRLGRLLGVTLS